MKYYAICFATENFEKTRARYVSALESKNIFKEVIQYSPHDFDVDFLRKNGEFINQNPKGYGHFIWKPYFILKALNKIGTGDILVYGDAGNEISGTPAECLALFNLVNMPSKQIEILASRVGWNIRWIKTDLYFRMGCGLFYPFKIMVEANRIVIKKNENTVKFIEEWLHYCTVDYRNIDDSKSKLPKLPFFIEHRHDQSIFSLLFHKHKGRITDFGSVWKASRLRY